ncbi:hypothetical protein [Gymnodinialimonas ceratoperidinii]|uniref:Uncharacterized protein n=1 Tax=Gymnodinialimonas ceratoperidinii TaxID=2856823 RepID=A0A8F6TYJ4_9RHOB|nr:hypothetical protein [Gymnodinialimonas ceratoperidinii]QXT41277.1 hypothetical protein KYE46_08725 [Gymnodinialimonas ceratoperidinii]
MFDTTCAACLCVLVTLPSAATAQAPSATEAETAVLARVIDFLCLDLQPEGLGCETVVLLQSEGTDATADLLVFAQDPSTDRRSVIAARGVVFSGPFDGQRPSLEAAADGTLLLHSEQFAVGRTPWTESLSIREHDGELSIIASAFSMLDRPAGGALSCDVDFVTGAWRVQAERTDSETGAVTQTWDQSGAAAIAPSPIGGWSDEPPIEQCNGVIAEWFAAVP